MKHTANYKFSDAIKSPKDFFDALKDAYSIWTVEKRSLGNEPYCYQLTIDMGDDGPNVQYELWSLDDCLLLATSRIDFMYHLSNGGYLVVAD